MKAKHFELPRGSELYRRVWITPGDLDYHRYSIFSLKIPDVTQGDIVHATTQFEVRNPYDFVVMVGHAMVISDFPNIFNRDSRELPGNVSFVHPCKTAGVNIEPEMRNYFFSFAGNHTVTWKGNAWIDVLVYAASNLALKTELNQLEYRAEVVQGDGGLSCIHYRNE